MSKINGLNEILLFTYVEVQKTQPDEQALPVMTFIFIRDNSERFWKGKRGRLKVLQQVLSHDIKHCIYHIGREVFGVVLVSGFPTGFLCGKHSVLEVPENITRIIS